ncbi:hypothetical protein [Methylobacter tundripaludum]
MFKQIKNGCGFTGTEETRHHIGWDIGKLSGHLGLIHVGMKAVETRCARLYSLILLNASSAAVNEIRNIAEKPMTAVTVCSEKKPPKAVPENSMIQKAIWQGQASNAKDAKDQPVKRLLADRGKSESCCVKEVAQDLLSHSDNWPILFKLVFID